MTMAIGRGRAGVGRGGLAAGYDEACARRKPSHPAPTPLPNTQVKRCASLYWRPGVDNPWTEMLSSISGWSTPRWGEAMSIEWTAFTPWSALAGGVIIGIAVAMFVLVNGRIAGVSGIVGGLLRPTLADVGWRAAFITGL